MANNFPSYATSLVPGGTVLLLGGTLVNGSGGYDTLREIDLAGDTLRETNINAVNAELAAMGQRPIYDFNHDAQLLPNGDTAVMARHSRRPSTSTARPPSTTATWSSSWTRTSRCRGSGTPSTGSNTSRLPTLGEGPSDWLHANSIAWSPEDGDLIVSLRAQDWVIKIDYANGTGDGHIVWTLGQGGNFTLVNPLGAVSPWFSHQHDVTYINDTTIVLFDDGNARAATDPNADSRGQEWVLNEQTMTATLVVNADLGNYSAALGSAQVLPNGNLAFTSGFQGSHSQLLRADNRGAPQRHPDFCATNDWP